MVAVDFRAVRQLVTVPQLLKSWGWVPTTRRTYQLRGPCPLHGSTSPTSRSLAVTRVEWYCHRCHVGGDVTDLHRALTGLPLLAAAHDLCERFGAPVPLLPGRQPPARNREEER